MNEAEVQNNEEESKQSVDIGTEEKIEINERPEWLPEKFWSENGEADYEKLANSYQELESFVGKKREELESEIISKIEAEAQADVPENKESYVIPEMPEGIEGDNPMMDWWKDYCFTKGLSQEDFNGGVEAFMTMGMTQPDIEGEKKKLGDNANARLEAVGLFVGKNFAPNEASAIENLCTTADGVLAIERIMEMQKTSLNQNADHFQSTQKTRKDLEEMMKDPRYSNPHKRDMAYVKQIDEAFAKMFK
jgi:hypothetical protein